MCDFPRMNQEETQNLNRLSSSNKIKSAIKNFQQTKVQDQKISQMKSPKYLKNNQHYPF